MKMMNGRHPEASREVVEALRAAPVAAPVALTDAQIREIFLAHGFTIKPGCDDLKPYVYGAARALLAAATSAAAPKCKGSPGECEYNGACMYGCGSAPAVAAPAQPDGHLHDDGCFTWAPGKRPKERDDIAGWYAPFYLSPAAPTAQPEPSDEAILAEAQQWGSRNQVMAGNGEPLALWQFSETRLTHFARAVLALRRTTK